jgi:hypothetical protein
MSGRTGRPREPRFSVVTIVRNEADRLPRLLGSLEEFRARGGEVLVLDTGSSDGTPEVAAQAGCRVVVEPRRFNRPLTETQARRINQTFARGGEGPLVAPGERVFHFARARAHAASLARHPFQLAVDGGDTVDVLDLDFIDGLARGRHPPIIEFETRMLSGSGWLLEVRGYLYDRAESVWTGRAHNYLVPRVPLKPPPPRTRLKRERLLVSHHTDMQKSRAHQLAGTALEALSDPSSPRWRYFLGRSLAAGGWLRSGLELLTGLDQPDVPPSVRSAALWLASMCAASLPGSEDEVEALLFQSARRDPLRRDALLRLAQRRLREGDLQGAASLAEAALMVRPQVAMSEPEENHTTGPHAILYWAYLWLGRREDGRRHLEICRKLDPGNALYETHASLFGKAAGPSA